MHGWEDEKHNWVFIGNFSVLDKTGRTVVPFSLKICRYCRSYMTDNIDSNEPEYETPRCLKSLAQPDLDRYIICGKSGRI